MPRTRRTTIFERVFNVEGLPDELRENVLSHLSLNELMAFECVSRRWQKNVTGVLKEVTVLTVVVRGQEVYDRFGCGIPHHSQQIISSPSNTATVGDKQHEPVIRLIAKMSNLVAAYLPNEWRSFDLMAALVNCSKLEHLDFISCFETGLETEIAKPLRPKLTCLAAYEELPQETVKEITSLKQLYCHPNDWNPIPLDHLTTLLKNGLVRLDTAIRPQYWDTICKLGSQLEHLNIEIRDENTDELSTSDVLQMVRCLPRLKKLKVNVPMESLVLLNGLEHLEDLAIDRLEFRDSQEFLEGMKKFGHRLHSLHIGNLYFNRAIGYVASECPNLKSLTFDYVCRGSRSPDFEIATLPKLAKLRVLKYDFRGWDKKKIVELLEAFPILQKLEGKVKFAGDELETFNSAMKEKFPKVSVEFTTKIHVY